jgi:hypothetical protein
MGASLILGRLFSHNYPGAPLAATTVFLVLWFVLAGINMWTGVAKAGYSVAEELPIFAVIFLVPAAVAALLKWKVL